MIAATPIHSILRTPISPFLQLWVRPTPLAQGRLTEAVFFRRKGVRSSCRFRFADLFLLELTCWFRPSCYASSALPHPRRSDRKPPHPPLSRSSLTASTSLSSPRVNLAPPSRHRAARRQHHPHPTHHQAKLHRRRTRHHPLYRPSLPRLRIQLRQPALHPGLHLRPAPQPKPADRRSPGRLSRAYPRLCRPPQVPPLRHPTLPRGRRRHDSLQAHPLRRPGPALPVPRRLLLPARPRG